MTRGICNEEWLRNIGAVDVAHDPSCDCAANSQTIVAEPPAATRGTHSDSWLVQIGAITCDSGTAEVVTDSPAVQGLVKMYLAHCALAKASYSLKRTLLRLSDDGRQYHCVLACGATLRVLRISLRNHIWRPSTVGALAAVMCVDLIDHSYLLKRSRRVLLERLS